MLIGHIGLGFAAKKVAPVAPLGVLLIAAEAVDILCGMFFLNHYAPQAPPEIPGRLLALPILVFIILFPWGQWIERHRALRLFRITRRSDSNG